MFTYCGNNPVTRSDASGFCFSELWRLFKAGVRKLLHTGNDIAVEMGIDTAALGAPFLCMSQGEDGIYSAASNCWQQYFGYNSLYDCFFDIGTSMETKSFEFEYNDTAYVIWAWKGDYINLGAGAELGVYYGGGSHWQAYTDWSMSMSLSLSYNGTSIINRTQNTWWITGFNPNYLNVQAKDLSATFVINFPNPEMYEAFAGTWNNISGWSCDPSNYSATFSF